MTPLPQHIQDRYPYYARVPKGTLANIQYRRKILEHASEDYEAQRELWIACSRDILFYINVFGYTYNPKRPGTPYLPMITWPFQDDAIYRLQNCLLKGKDALIEKSRDMGASWLALFLLKHEWHFHDGQAFLALSRKEDLVDKSGDPDSLFWKIDFMIEFDPKWLKPQKDRINLMFTNLANRSTIAGESTNSNAGRGGRKKAIFIDEYAAVENGDEIDTATADTTRCRIFASTPQGVGNAFYRKSLTSIEKITLHWSLHPEKREGLYRPAPKGPEIVDHEFWQRFRREDGRYTDPRDANDIYKFSTEVPRGRFGLRSVWYDGECERRASPVHIAQELDIDYQGSGFQFFDPGLIEKAKTLNCRAPDAVGRLEFDFDTFEPLRFIPDGRSNLELWTVLTDKGRPDPARQYAIGADISQGTGASNSSLCIADKVSKVKVAQFTTPHMDPTEFAKNAVVIGRWFNNALLCWEVNGPGTAFGNTVQDLNYSNIFFRRQEDNFSKKYTDKPGWVSGGSKGAATKQALLSDYRQAVQSGIFINRSAIALDECLDYVFDDSGGVLNAKSRNDADPTGAKDNHGDRVIADALCWKMIRTPVGKKKTTQEELEATREPPRNSFGGRRLQEKRQREKLSRY
jgi:hypothetical protein